jgi:hypothetical protein
MNEENLKTEYPPNHKVGMRVPKGGSCCANCKFWDGKDCESKYYRMWNNRSGKIPAPPDEYCSDFWEPKPIKK